MEARPPWQLKEDLTLAAWESCNEPFERWLIAGTVVLVLGAFSVVNREVIAIVAACMLWEGSRSTPTGRWLLCRYLDRIPLRPWQSRRRSPPHLVYGFLTTAPNAVVEPIHPKGDASDPDDGRGARRLDARAMGRGEGFAAAAARRRAQNCHARSRQGR